MWYNKRKSHQRFLRNFCKLFKTKKIDQILINGHYEDDELLKAPFIEIFIFYLNIVEDITHENVFSKHTLTDQHVSPNKFNHIFHLNI